MTELKQSLIRRIEATGPITLAEFMAECLMHPQHGYYQKERVFGKDGDFITAPEVSQMFGEIIGLYMADRWYKMGKPQSFHLIEFGPGRGTLMADILRATAPVEGFVDAAEVHFIETSLQLRELQKKKVPHGNWHDTLNTVPEGPSLIIGNEFFDALPIHQYERQNGEWLERRVHVEDGVFQLVVTKPTAHVALIPEHMKDGPDGSIAEICPSALSIMGDIALRLNTHGGSALFLDYGYRISSFGDTFQALKNHEYVDPFAEPGAADLTAHVAFDQLHRAATEAHSKAYGSTPQGMFLMALGIGSRAQALASGADAAKQEKILSELKRLTAPDEMGTLFKVLAVQNHELPPPPGF
ncbi:SAM-dependent methyltransferase [Kordiimonas sp. SCSIO 12603]|uniref:class I SAM-dependent methyltransferase n=1 Tax=Kordiimonas sp. SCSIO 12603 TaxID=2829596 RepID=UPI0021042063|nr:SAM-dependent methyltransferase [Kordiimonas sp. SCSIO 12603]UTW60116.1 SAM-dependent methyltransferase [Kordiimonas sp. SCSIO 12603]